MPCYRMLPDSTKVKLQFLLTANGMSYSRALNDKSEIAFTSKNKLINNNLSRRVEFKLVTTNPKLAENL